MLTTTNVSLEITKLRLRVELLKARGESRNAALIRKAERRIRLLEQGENHD